LKEALKYSNEELIKGIQNKDNLVLSYIINKNKKSIRQYVLTNSGYESDANDVLQEAIIVLFRKVKEDDFKLTSSLNTFIYSIARLIWLKELENRRTRNTFSEPFDVIDYSDSIHATIEKNDRLRLYREKFEELGEDCKKVLRLFYLGTPMSQITQFMGYNSDDYTKKKKYTCKNVLVEKIKSSKLFNELGNGND
jgi:RNA polymerase sigma factor (sigma-70 family)